MAKLKFDPDAAFKNIVGVTEAAGKGGDELAGSDMAATLGAAADEVVIVGNHDKEETRSKRVNLVIKPSVYDMSKTKCEGLGISLNECVNQFLEKWSKE